MRLWIAYWLRKLAQRLDGDDYARVLPVPGVGRFRVYHPIETQRLDTGCECDYWPGITGSNGRITQHAVGCPQRPDARPAKPEPRLPDPFRKP